MLDEATSAAEAMTLAKRSVKAKGNTLVVGGDMHPQTLEVIQTRAEPLGLAVKVATTPQAWAKALQQDDYFAAINQYPGSTGWMIDWTADAQTIHSKGAALILATDLL
ncbi:glycine dehydrogenase (aminomethyl-transferring), partial [Arthrospira platensis SPKY1]|nr:glycine dehydrogenase (aminomethyl-transferring) [Arthrospira platensis SPKY1]